MENAYNLAQYQADILNYADGTMRRMNELAYQASDIDRRSRVDREVLDAEFSHSKQLKDLLFDRTYDKVMFDSILNKY